MIGTANMHAAAVRGGVVVAGGSGFIGGAVVRRLVASGHEVVVLTRRPGTLRAEGGVVRVQWNAHDLGPWVDFIGGARAIVNLSGENIAGLWTREKRRRILESRVAAGRALVEAIAEVGSRPVLIQASAVGFYGDRGGEELQESSARGRGFLPTVVEAWEASTAQAARLGVRRVVLRLGVVLGRGGFLHLAMPLFRLGLGARIGSGRQWLSWVHRHDVVNAVEFALSRSDLTGVFNVSAPEPVTNAEFTRSLAERLHRPVLLAVPAPLLRLGGAMPRELLLASQRVMPKRLLEAGFRFDYSHIRIALESLQ